MHEKPCSKLKKVLLLSDKFDGTAFVIQIQEERRKGRKAIQ